MRIALNWFEVTLPVATITVPVETVESAPSDDRSSPQRVRYPHRVVQRRGPTGVRLLHLTDSPPAGTQEERIVASEDPGFLKIAIEEGFARLLGERGFMVNRKHVGGTAYIKTEESLWPEIYTFFRGLSFRAFYFLGGGVGRWGLVLNYVTSQRFCVTIADPHLRTMALGRRVVRATDVHGGDDDEQPGRGILVSVDGPVATVDLGDDQSVESPVLEWTLPCRRELLHDYVAHVHGTRDASELTRRLQQAAFCLTSSGRMNTALTKNQVEAVQRLLHDHRLGQIALPLPSRPPVSLTTRPLLVGE